jgi:hypothetical protein
MGLDVMVDGKINKGSKFPISPNTFYQSFEIHQFSRINVYISSN